MNNLANVETGDRNVLSTTDKMFRNIVILSSINKVPIPVLANIILIFFNYFYY